MSQHPDPFAHASGRGATDRTVGSWTTGDGPGTDGEDTTGDVTPATAGVPDARSTGTGAIDAIGDEDAADLDAEDVDLLPASFRLPVNRLTAVLGVAILAVTAFAAGALVQRQFGSSGSSGRGAVSRPGSYGAAGFPGGQGGGNRGGGTWAGGSAGGAAGSTADRPGANAAPAALAAVGTVVSVSGNTLTIKNFGGKTVTITVPKGTAITTTTTNLAGLSAGQTVTVTGTTGKDGTITASAVTARESG